MPIFSSDDDKREYLVRKWYRDYKLGDPPGRIQTPDYLHYWMDQMKQHGVAATFVMMVESPQGEHNRGVEVNHGGYLL